MIAPVGVSMFPSLPDGSSSPHVNTKGAAALGVRLSTRGSGRHREAAKNMIFGAKGGQSKTTSSAALGASLDWLNEALADRGDGDRSDDSDPSVDSGS